MQRENGRASAGETLLRAAQPGAPVPRPVDLLRPHTPWAAEEVFETLLERGGLRLERIVSTGQTTPPDACYDQSWDEWVVLLSGEAVLEFPDARERVRLRPGEALLIPARCRHRVAWTHADVQTIWLAVHLPEERSGGEA